MGAKETGPGMPRLERRCPGYVRCYGDVGTLTYRGIINAIYKRRVALGVEDSTPVRHAHREGSQTCLLQDRLGNLTNEQKHDTSSVT